MCLLNRSLKSQVIESQADHLWTKEDLDAKYSKLEKIQELT